MKKIFGHIKTVFIHKWFVAKYCFKFGLYWQGIFHDMSKFSPTEFFESVKYYTGTISPINVCKEKNGKSMAWFHHRGRNKHHYEYWCDDFDKGTRSVRMPWRYATEMLCDYLGAARAYNGSSFTIEDEIKWWENKRMIAKIHPDTKDYITDMLNLMNKGYKGSLRKWSKYVYNKHLNYEIKY